MAEHLPLSLYYGDGVSTPTPQSLDEALAVIFQLEQDLAAARAEVQRVRDELRRTQRDRHETPPHYL